MTLSPQTQCTPESVDLNRHAFIEASAGTGKTWLLERLFVRILKQANGRGDFQSLEEIVVVTFTEKAATEMRERIRSQLQNSIDSHQGDDALRSHLQRVMHSFDEARICTIHSFCREILTEYALDCGVPLAHEVIQDSGVYAEVFERLLRSWRERNEQGAALLRLTNYERGEGWKECVLRLAQRHDCYPLDRPSPFGYASLREAVLDVFEKYRRALEIISSNMSEIQEYLRSDDPDYNKKILPRFRAFYALCEELCAQCGAAPPAPSLADALFAFEGIDRLRARLGASENAGNPFNELAKKLEKASSKKGRRTLEDVFPACGDFIEALGAALQSSEDARALAFREILHTIRVLAKRLKRERRVLSFDDMILSLAEGLADNPSLLRRLRERFRYAFIDEFQDSDGTQWDIFRKIFLDADEAGNEGSGRLFLIGDPKQAIYGFRGGDVATYFKARGVILDHGGLLYTLPVNWRSVPVMTEACNRLFQAGWFQKNSSGAGREIQFIPSRDYSGAHTEGTGQGKEERPASDSRKAPVIIVRYKNKVKKFLFPAHAAWTAREIIRLTHAASSDAAAGRDGTPPGNRILRYSDCAVLVRSRRDAESVMRAFRREGIPFLQYKHDGLWSTPEAEALLALADALAAEDSGKIALAFLTPFFACALSSLDRALSPESGETALLSSWRAYADARKWAVLAAQMEEAYAVNVRFGSDAGEIDQRDWERRLANMRQLLAHSLLAPEAYLYSPGEMALSLRLRYDSAALARDGEDIQPLSSENDRVRIMTMHMAKGLQFPIVFVHGGLGSFKSGGFYEYYADEESPEEGGKIYDTANREKAKAEAYWQSELERLVYVAVTRAMLRVYLIHSGKDENTKGRAAPMYACLARALQTVIESGDPHFEIVDGDDSENEYSSAAPAAYREVRVPPLVFPHPYPGGVQFPVRAALSFSYIESREKNAKGIAGNPAALAATASRELKGAEGEYAELRADELREEYDALRKDDEPSPLLASAPSSPGLPESQGLICLARGKESGLAIHSLLEDMDFARASSDHAYRRELIRHRVEDSGLAAPASWLKRRMLLPSLAEGAAETAARDEITAYLENLLEGLLMQSLPLQSHSSQFLSAQSLSGAAESSPFSLSRITPQHCLKELIFCERNPFARYNPLEDMMNGVIDLVFRHEGRYYIADWKTNWLPDYGLRALSDEMEAQGYYLQAALYADAVRKWLRLKKLPEDAFGSVLYIFVRAFTTGPYRESFTDDGAQNDTGAREARGDTPGVLFMDAAEVSALEARYQIGGGA